MSPDIDPYRLLDEGQAIECLRCGAISHHPEDVRHRYCGRCHRFHDDGRPMTATPLVIGPAELAALAALRERAASRPVDMPRLMEAIKTTDGKAAHSAQMRLQSVPIPLDFLVTFSIETGHPIGTCRHMSMSTGKRGRVPSPPAVWMVAETLGFVGGLAQPHQRPALPGRRPRPRSLRGLGVVARVVRGEWEGRRRDPGPVRADGRLPRRPHAGHAQASRAGVRPPLQQAALRLRSGRDRPAAGGAGDGCGHGAGPEAPRTDRPGRCAPRANQHARWGDADGVPVHKVVARTSNG